MDPFLARLARVLRDTAPTRSNGVCPATQQAHISAVEALLQLTNEGKAGTACLEVHLCSACQALFYVRE